MLISSRNKQNKILKLNYANDVSMFELLGTHVIDYRSIYWLMP